MVGASGPLADESLLVGVEEVAAHEVHVLLGNQAAHLFYEEGAGGVVDVQEPDVLPGGGLEADVAVAAEPLALVLGDDGRTGELSREFAGLLERAVVAAGVDHEDRFESLIGLCPEEGDAAFDVTGPVAYRDHHGNVELTCSCVCLRIYGISPHGSFTEKGTSYRGRIRYLR